MKTEGTERPERTSDIYAIANERRDSAKAAGTAPRVTATTTREIIERLAFLAQRSEYNPERKEEYRRLGQRVLKAIVANMGLTPSQYDIRWNPGGDGVSGDHTLHTDKVYLALHDNCGMGWFYYRSCNGRRDYTGGPNQVVTWAEFARIGIWGLAERLNKIQQAPVGYCGNGIGNWNRVALSRMSNNGSRTRAFSSRT